jgi:hypothetical protein
MLEAIDQWENEGGALREIVMTNSQCRTPGPQKHLDRWPTLGVPAPKHPSAAKTPTIAVERPSEP